MQFNCNGIQGKASEIAAFLHARDIKIAAIQETKLRPKNKMPNLGYYAVVRLDRSRGEGGGVAFLVHESINFREIDIKTDGILEAVGIRA